MHIRERIQQAADAEFPGCAVLFDDQTKDEGDVFRFQVESSNGRIISRTYPYFKEADFEAKSDEEIRATIRQLCGK